MNRLASLLHSLSCEKHHPDSMETVLDGEDSSCHFYLEQSLSTAWDERDHVVWLNETRAFMEELDTTNPQEALDIFKNIMSIVRAASILLEEHPAARGILLKLLS